jgi:sarcosine oxidase subunit alpha
MANKGTGERLTRSEHELIDRDAVIEFEFEGRRVSAYQGDTVGSAVTAVGIDILSRSFKYHRPRGMLCAAGNCPNCLMTVDGIPNVRSCTMQVQPGMKVKRQNAWPSVDHDIGSLLDRMDRLLPVGFYYKAFHKPKFLWDIMRPIVRRIAGLGKIDISSDGGPRYSHRNMQADVAVIGGGPAGMAAALEAADAGLDVVLIDDQPALGGHLLSDTARYEGIEGVGDGTGQEIADSLRGRVVAQSGIRVLSGASAFGYYQDNLIAVRQGLESIQLRAGRVVMATGAFEVPFQFENNDRPGVMLASGALRMARLYGVPPGKRALVVTDNDGGYSSALNLIDAELEIAALVDLRSDAGTSDVGDAVRKAGIEVLAGYRVVSASGKKRVSWVKVMAPDSSTRVLKCDLVCMAGVPQPANGLLLQQPGVEVEYDEQLRESVPARLPGTVFTAGDINGFHDLGIVFGQGVAAGRKAAGVADDGSSQLSALEGEYRNGLRLSGDSASGGSAKKEFVCLCEDVSTKDIGVAIREGFGDIQTLKRYTTSTMGPCQGKMCHKAFVEATAIHTGGTIAATGATTARPPAQGVPLGALAGPGHMPLKRTPLDAVHRAAGAEMVELGPWLRAHNYGSPQDEALTVRERVGIIDVSTLGKLDVRGADAGKLLDKVYTHRFSNLKEGRIRYGLLCGENGVIMDDGTVTRLSEDHYFVSTTTGNVDAIEDWFNWWLAGTGMDVFVTNVTSAYGAINVAGPRARETLSKLTDVDLSSDAFGYMRSFSGAVAGVPCIFLRIGFVGETGWELHFPSEYAEHLWKALMEAGAEYGIGPFGLEAQRILRLEKGHIIVSQDTDAATDPLDAGMRWAVRFDKPDFIGRAGLAANRKRESEEKLVGFVMRGDFVPEDGQPIVESGVPIGRVTSSRLSPTLKKGFGLGWVPEKLAEEGAEILIRSGDKDWPAVVATEPIYDPKGERLRN